MAASSTCDSLSVSNISLQSARCTGFAKVKGQNDYAFIIDLEWSDERNMSIKRTYRQFQELHASLLKLFPELRQAVKTKLRLQTSLKENMASLFAKDKRALAESREQMVDAYLVNLLRQPERVRCSNAVISFFEPTETDPKPCKSTSPNEKSDSGIDLTNDQKLFASHRLDAENHHNQKWKSRYESDSGDDYDSETSGTETDSDPFDEDYLLDVGFAELMLQSAEDDMSRSTDSSAWCSNLNTFSNILHTLPNVDNSSKRYNTMTSSLYNLYNSDDDCNEVPQTMNIQENKDGSDAENRMICAENELADLESDDEFMSKPLAQHNMKHYYLSTNDLITE